jgi:hypothetical protein
MSDDREHAIATATVTSEEKPYGVRIDARGHALRGVGGHQRAMLAEKTPVTRAVRAGTEIRTTTGTR